MFGSIILSKTKNDFAATTAPTVNSDKSEGYKPGSIIYIPTTGATYICVSNVEGAAVWRLLSGEQYISLWNPVTNTPTLIDGTGTAATYYIASVDGTRNLGSGSQTFTAGDKVIASSALIWQKQDGGTSYVPENAANKDVSGGYVGLTLFKINFKNALNTFTSFFTNSNTAARTYTFQDRDGTIADLANLATKITSTNYRIITASGTYTPTAGTAYADFICVGGGGGGGGVANSTAAGISGAGGGGGGGVSNITLTALQIGASQVVTIGGGGAGGIAGANAGANGGDTSIGSLCIAKGGTGATGAAQNNNSVGGAGGVAGTGTSTIPGQNGTTGQSGVIITLAILAGGAGGNAPGCGAGGNGAVSGAGANGKNYGGGGAGAASFAAAGNLAGGNGAGGASFITEYII